MLRGNITINKYNPEQTIARLCPLLKGEGTVIESGDPVIRYFYSLEDDTLPTLIGAMPKLTSESQTELIAIVGNACAKPLCTQINQTLSGHPLGKWARVGSVALNAAGKNLCLQVNEIQVDYRGLIKEKVPGPAGNIISRLTGVFCNP